MNIKTTYPVMIFKEDKDGKPSYKVGLSRKDEDGEYENAYFPVRFKQGIEIENKTKITINNAFLTFNKYTDAEGKNRTFTYVMILDYDVDDGEKKSSTRSIDADEIELTEDDFPF